MDSNRLAAWFWTAVLFGFALASSWVVLAVMEGAPVWRSRRRGASGQTPSHSASGSRTSRHLIAALWVAYGFAVMGLAASFEHTAARTPLILIALGLPLLFRLVPPNFLYGMRSPRTLMTTDEIWYRQNVITGVALVVGGVVWLALLAAGVSLPFTPKS